MGVEDLITGILSLAAIGISIVTYIQNVGHDRKRDTLDAFNTLQNEVLDQINTYTPTEIKEIAKNPRSKEYKELSALLARLQHFSVGVNSRVYDERIVKRLAGVYFLSVYYKLEPLIEKKRSINKTEKHYNDFESLVAKMRETDSSKHRFFHFVHHMKNDNKTH